MVGTKMNQVWILRHQWIRYSYYVVEQLLKLYLGKPKMDMWK